MEVKNIIESQGIKITKDVFEDVQLTEEEKQFALYEARKAKHLRLFKEDYAKRVMREVKYMKLDAVGSRAWALKLFRDKEKKDFVIDQTSEVILNILSAYFGKDDFFLTFDKDYSFDKGIALFGNVGVGKTTLMRMFYQNTHQSYAVVSCSLIARDYSNWNSNTDAQCPTDRFSTWLKGDSSPIFNPFGHEKIGYCFDDLGTEEIPAKNYGRDRNIMADIFLSRYANKSIPFNMTHLTTNLTTDKIKEAYGDRVYDRMKEMLNIIQFDTEANSRR